MPTQPTGWSSANASGASRHQNGVFGQLGRRAEPAALHHDRHEGHRALVRDRLGVRLDDPSRRAGYGDRYLRGAIGHRSSDCGRPRCGYHLHRGKCRKDRLGGCFVRLRDLGIPGIDPVPSGDVAAGSVETSTPRQSIGIPGRADLRCVLREGLKGAKRQSRQISTRPREIAFASACSLVCARILRLALRMSRQTSNSVSFRVSAIWYSGRPLAMKARTSRSAGTRF